jgi:hypothetical protein
VKPRDIDTLREAFLSGKSDKVDKPWLEVRLVEWSDDADAWVLTAKGSELLTGGQ